MFQYYDIFQQPKLIILKNLQGGQTPLQLASSTGVDDDDDDDEDRAAIIALLLSAGAKVESRNCVVCVGSV